MQTGIGPASALNARDGYLSISVVLPRILCCHEHDRFNLFGSGFAGLGNRTSMSMMIQEVPTTDAPMELLLLADPSEDKVRSYLPKSKCFVALKCGVVVGACVVQPLGADSYELMSIAVKLEHQQCGCGTALLKWVIDYYRKTGASQIEVGTGSFGYQLSFYQKHGFRITGIVSDFFVNNYREPIFEDGIQLFDMLRLTLRFPDNVA